MTYNVIGHSKLSGIGTRLNAIAPSLATSIGQAAIESRLEEDAGDITAGAQDLHLILAVCRRIHALGQSMSLRIGPLGNTRCA
jgi:hypothetical protein